LTALAERLGHSDKFRYASSQEVFDDLRRASAGAPADYSGITYERLDDEQGVFWPCPTADHPGTPRMFVERFGHRDGRARMTAVEYRSAAEQPDADYPLYLTTGRYREHYNSGSQTRSLARLVCAKPSALLQLHPNLADELGITHGSPVVVESRRGSAVFEAEISEGIRRDTVFAPFHWGGTQSANILTLAALDPVSKMPEFKVCAVRVQKLVDEDRL
jgi:assimilatory nitrate reductase catalytic subunit